jgi:hypothetical protein
MLNYPEYYKKAAENYGSPPGAISKFYQTGIYHIGSLSERYHELVKEVGAQVKNKIDEVEKVKKSLLTDYSDIFSLQGPADLADEIIPRLEKDLYGCHLFVDKIYCYRNHYYPERSSSWLWHWDNNPQEVVKIMIYLTDVDDSMGPFEYMMNPDGSIPIKKTTRTGYNNWKKPPNNSRITEREIDKLIKSGGKPVRVTGQAGTVTIFNNNVWHRANIPVNGKYRDIITLRVRPTIDPVIRYVDKAWTTTSKVTGAVPKDPAQIYKLIQY